MPKINGTRVINKRMDYLAQARSVIQIELEEVQRLHDSLGEPFCQAIDLFKETIEQGKKIVWLGVGKSGNIAHKIAATFNSTGATSVVLNSQNALHGDLGIINSGDVVVALSYSGETEELINLLPFIKRLDTALIGMTGKAQSSLGEEADITLETYVSREACPLNLAPTSSSTNMLVLGDALAMVLLEARGFTESDFAAYHPGGSLGKALLTRVHDIMRTGNGMAAVPSHSNIKDCLSAMKEARAGACILSSPDKTPASFSIFTHGDFARAFEQGQLTGLEPATDFATQSPISISQNALAVEAVNLLREHLIDDLVVLDADGNPVGMVDSQDLSRLKLV